MKPDEEIRAAAIQAAATVVGHLQTGQDNGDPGAIKGAIYSTVNMAKAFEEFIKYGNVKG
ncbi:hypothetical protein AB0N62_43085 [Streptomyces sp. NPDC093982]|uniref:hypothetical protein n=1 Tax=Streptomyces sp. NPDC093982 TaxID=3155077 RepID=UPI0034162588